MDIHKLEALTEARKRTWQSLQQAIGADAASRAFATQCRAAMNAACAADEDANAALHAYVRAQAESVPPPQSGEGT